MMGYYASSFNTREGGKGSYGLTQFEPTQARRAFVRCSPGSLSQVRS